jgi:hypothetical protein
MGFEKLEYPVDSVIQLFDMLDCRKNKFRWAAEDASWIV